nr:hypothetical protein CFP56_51028 [Quercus suber]
MSIHSVVVLNNPTPAAKSRAGTSPTRLGVNTFKPSNTSPMTLLESEDLAWEKFNQAITNEDVAICYDMSMKEFERSTIHDLFKAMSKFMAESKQAYELDHTRIRLEEKIRDMEESSHRMRERMKLEAEEVELKNLAEELSCPQESKDEVIREFKSSKECTDLLDANYAVGFEDFRMDTIELFLEMNFDSIKLRTVAESSLHQTSLEDFNVEDDASIPFPAKDGSKSGGDVPSGLSP